MTLGFQCIIDVGVHKCRIRRIALSVIDAYDLQKLGGQRHWKQAEGKSGIAAQKKNQKNRSLTNFKQDAMQNFLSFTTEKTSTFLKGVI